MADAPAAESGVNAALLIGIVIALALLFLGAYFLGRRL
jgi:hypothetical protein